MDVRKGQAPPLAPRDEHLKGRVCGVVVHGDVGGVDGTRRALIDWLDWMGLFDAGFAARPAGCRPRTASSIGRGRSDAQNRWA